MIGEKVYDWGVMGMKNGEDGEEVKDMKKEVGRELGRMEWVGGEKRMEWGRV